MDILMDQKVELVSLIGKAGTGKTLLAVASGIQQVLEDKRYSKLIVSRPIQPVGRDIGYLPGTKEEKMSPWIQPIIDNFEHLFSETKKSRDFLDMYMENGTIEVEAITYIRGRSIPNAFIIIDEAQNLSVDEVKTIITRVGQGSKIVLTGDIDQIDNHLIDAVSNGLTYAVEKFKDYDLAGHVTLMKGERSKLSKLAAQIL
jgi:PhoH-like ATPase